MHTTGLDSILLLDVRIKIIGSVSPLKQEMPSLLSLFLFNELKLMKAVVMVF